VAGRLSSALATNRDASMFVKRSEKLLLLSGFGGSVW